MLQVRKKDVPSYLCDSALYRTLFETDPSSDEEDEHGGFVSCDASSAATHAETDREMDDDGDSIATHGRASDSFKPSSCVPTAIGSGGRNFNTDYRYGSRIGGDCNCAEIPRYLMKPNTSLQSFEDLRQLLSTLRFWGSEQVLEEVIEFCFSTRDTDRLGEVLGEFSMELQYLQLIIDMMSVSTDAQRLVIAAGGGNTELLMYLKCSRSTTEWSAALCEVAAARGHLHCLRFLHEHHCPWDEETCTAAAHNGQLQCLQYAAKNGCPYDRWTLCRTAAKEGHLNCLMFARLECGGEWYGDDSTFWAAAHGHLDCLRFAHENDW